MNEHLRYEGDLMKRLNDLPLPNEDKAWEDMKRRLEKDNEDGPVIPPVSKGCGGHVLLLLLLFVIAGLFIAVPLKWFHDKNKNEKIQNDVKNKEQDTNHALTGNKPLSSNTLNKVVLNDDTVFEKSATASSKYINDTASTTNEELKKQLSSDSNNHQQKQYTAIRQYIRKGAAFRQHNNRAVVNNNYRHKPVSKKTGGKSGTTVSGYAQEDTAGGLPQKADQTGGKTPAKVKDSIIGITVEARPGPDPMKKKTNDSTLSNAKAKPAPPEEKRIYFSAGVAMHQLLPVAGQKSTPYNSLGRKSSFGDYIPSIYGRMYKDKKWFLQSEFRYGAPQYTKQIVFNQKKIIDTGSLSVIATNSSIKKTFYHQLPLSFNYFVLPGLSIGTGITFNKFRSALVQQDIHKISTVTQIDSLVSTGLVSQKKADSNFVTSYVQALFETQYQWRRFSAGARYSFGLQPYLKFKLPGGEERKERNSALQLFIRYELWRSGK